MHPVPGDRSGPDEGLGQEVAERPIRYAGGGEEQFGESGPTVGNLREHGEPGPDVLTALGVVGRQAGHRQRLVSLALDLQPVELLDRDAELRRVAAHLVQGDEPGVAVVGRVLDPLGHRRAAELLQPPGQFVAMIMKPRAELVQGPGQLRTPPCGRGQRMIKIIRTGRQVGPVDLEGDRDLGERGFGTVDLRDQPRHPVQLGGQQLAHHHPFADLDVLGDRLLITGQLLIQRGEVGLVIMIDEDAVDLAHGVIAGGALDRPIGQQRLARFQDLFHGDPLVRGQLAQPAQILAGLDEPVGMVDAQAGDPGAGPVTHPDVRRLQHARVLDPDAGQGRHGEEPAVVQLLVAPRPVHQLVVLPPVDGGRVVTLPPAARSQWEPVVEVPQLAVGHGQRLIIAEHRNHDPAPAPVDVEPVGVRGFPTQAQHVPPRRVLHRCRDPEMIGHDVDHHTEPRRAGTGQQAVEARIPAAVTIDPRRVGGVVAVIGADRRLQHRRQVDRSDTEFVQVAVSSAASSRVKSRVICSR